MRRIVLLLAIAALLGSTVATVDAAGASHGVRARAVKMRLHRFSSCKRLVKYARSRAPREIRYAAGPVVAPGTPPAFAQTDDTPSRGGDNAGAEGVPTDAPPPSLPAAPPREPTCRSRASTSRTSARPTARRSSRSRTA